MSTELNVFLTASFKESIRTVLNDAVKNTFSSVDMTTV